ncbi:MAG TPA: zf-HC2 domain-containing protein [Candidatus Angelobacter sp.]|nr:zf-HC2 domain-containing protein [Candidatus Angelobacter sp.]
MKCSDFLQELTNYLDGALDARTKTELEGHLAWCHNCYVVCDTTKKTIEIYRDSTLYELPEDLRTRLRSAIVSKCKSHKPDAEKA